MKLMLRCNLQVYNNLAQFYNVRKFQQFSFVDLDWMPMIIAIAIQLQQIKMEKVWILWAHTSLVLYTCYTIWSVQPGTSLFSWHPTFMTLSQLLALEGIILFKTISAKWKVTVHWICQGAALAALITGFTIIFINKNLREKPHFTSTHGIAGISVLILMALQNLGGAIVKLSPKLKFVSTKQLRAGHRLSGILFLGASLGTVTLVTSNKLLYLIALVLPAFLISSNVFQIGFLRLKGQTKK